ncbi:MAG: EamA family transporter, partial [Candidatus Gracilibacteria bacterium]
YYLLLQYALKTSSPLATSTTLYLQPLFAIIWASILLGEHLTSGLVIGGILAFIGIGLVMSKKTAR